jgi:hypothetical protein
VSRLVRLPSAGGAHRPFGCRPNVIHAEIGENGDARVAKVERQQVKGLKAERRQARRPPKVPPRRSFRSQLPVTEASNLTAQRSGQVDRSVELVKVASGISAAKYGADDFENANAVTCM